ncbi:MAG: DUF3783 domain-containing protein [Faecalibacterium sp.]|jgi:hypothetical protein|nr:DUF3783 domain-containing protein [Faecalibacterium sp.]
MKAHIAANPNAGRPTILCWGLSSADRGKLDGMAASFGMRIVPVMPTDAAKTVACLLGEAEGGGAARALAPDAYPAAALFANFRPRDLDTLLDLLHQAQVEIPLKAAATATNRAWAFDELLGHLAAERAAFARQAEAEQANKPPKA